MKTMSRKSKSAMCNVESEICVAGAMCHPNIAMAYGAFRDAERIHLVLELCTGGELFDRVAGTKGLGEAASASYARQILRATSHLHSLCIAHRDVKPENFLLKDASPGAALKMIDFGAARLFRPGQPMHTYVGTSYYVAPQVLKQRYDEGCDVWSAGVVLYVLLCGGPPFWGGSTMTIHRMILKGSVEFASPAWGGISADAKAVVTSMLTWDQGQRPSAEEVLASPWILQEAEPSYTAADALVVW